MSFVAFFFTTLRRHGELFASLNLSRPWVLLCDGYSLPRLCLLGFCLTVVPLAWCLSPPALACRVQYLFQK